MGKKKKRSKVSKKQLKLIATRTRTNRTTLAANQVARTYKLDEYGYLASRSNLEDFPSANAVTSTAHSSVSQPDIDKPTEDAVSEVDRTSPKNVDTLPESTPAGHLDLLQLSKSGPLPIRVSPGPSTSPNQLSVVLESSKAGTSSGKLKCKQCGALMDPDRLQRHIEMMHQPPAASSSARRSRYILCPECNVSLKPEQLQRHLKASHSKRSRPVKESSATRSVLTNKQPSLVTCPECGVSVAAKRLDKHLRKVHALSGSQQAGSMAAARPTQSPTKKKSSRLRISVHQQPAELEQAFHEPRFGDKYVGLSRRESGRFGSISLYDDYSDEADAD